MTALTNHLRNEILRWRVGVTHAEENVGRAVDSIRDYLHEAARYREMIADAEKLITEHERAASIRVAPGRTT